MDHEEPQNEPVVEYGAQYQDGMVIWDLSPLGGVVSPLANETGRAKAQDDYKFVLKRAGIKPDASNRLKFVKRTRTVVFSAATEVV
ncbi:hypothetical protein [Cryobacterium cryoconiti]|uniref:Uncharacterized protein n=1 Tax=Cryobacterium cryoconiti TaxID=1259239 RepID=A0A4Y8JRF7_9MICO|nr:hypothetical protein [Cryobacterium cryoconiti]TFD27492.1 hypothetical protein E3T49_13195 [Cryobacterium cryoconiti]